MSTSGRRRSASPEPRRARDHDSRRERDGRRDHHKSRRRERDEEQDDGGDDGDEVGPPPPLGSGTHPRLAAFGASAIDEDDFYQKAAEFKHWLRTSRKKYLDELSSRDARRYFDKFVRKWNAGELEDAYYKGEVRTAGSSAASQTRHRWGFTASKLTREEQDLLETTRDNVDTLTNANSRGAIEAREAERRLGKGKRMSERDGETARAAGPSAPEDDEEDGRPAYGRGREQGTSANAGARDSGWKSARNNAHPSDFQFEREERADERRIKRQAEGRRERKELREEADELAPKATGREALFERKREIRESHRAFANRRDGDDGFDLNEDVILGGGGGGSGSGGDFRAAVAERDRAAAKTRERAERHRAERAAEGSERHTAMRQKEQDTMAMFKAMAAQRFGGGGPG
ncbi:hypothetical protein OC835_005604 [Tilletia horrida]|nr:hypothetical protein OC835_005604 [Tilletia horrida]